MNYQKLAAIQERLDREVCVPFFLEFLESRHGIKAANEKEAKSLVTIGAELYRHAQQQYQQQQEKKSSWLESVASSLTGKPIDHDDESGVLEKVASTLASTPDFQRLIAEMHTES